MKHHYETEPTTQLVGATDFPVDPVELMQGEFSARHRRNPSFSLRAFARFLGIAPGPMSEILARKRSLTLAQGQRIAEKIGFLPDEKKKFLAALCNPPAVFPKPNKGRADYQKLAADKFALVADWYHLAILNLFDTVDASGDEAWIAKRLGLTKIECRSALQRLARLRLCRPVANVWKLVRGSATVTDGGIPSAAVRKHHRQNLENAIRKLDEVPMAERDFSSITMAIDVRKMDVAKRRIKRFRRSLAKYLESGEKTEVYQLNIQLLPVTVKEKKK